jgi:hypothetical protein
LILAALTTESSPKKLAQRGLIMLWLSESRISASEAISTGGLADSDFSPSPKEETL